MNRCTFMRHCLLALTLLSVGPLLAQIAPAPRSFPPNALRGELTIVQTPVVLMNEQQDKLSPGSRIRNEFNRLVLPASLTGRKLIVNYTRESYGMIHEVWILTETEAAEKRPTSPQKPAQDSAETINKLNKLPRYQP
jgi:hypothetical protein